MNSTAQTFTTLLFTTFLGRYKKYYQHFAQHRQNTWKSHCSPQGAPYVVSTFTECLPIRKYVIWRICATRVAGNKIERPHCNSRNSDDTRWKAPINRLQCLIFHNKQYSNLDRQSDPCGTEPAVAEGASHLEGRHTNTEVQNLLSLSPKNEAVSLSVIGAHSAGTFLRTRYW